MLVVGNKCDIPERERIIMQDKAKRVSEEWHAMFMETSATEKYQVEEAFDALIEAALKYKEGCKYHSRKLRAVKKVVKTKATKSCLLM